MAVKYIVELYGCKYKCGHKHLKDKSIIEDHEKCCWYNPENKTCKTCKHEKYWFDEDNYGSNTTSPYPGEGAIRECNIDAITGDEYCELAVYSETKKHQHSAIKPKENCSKWASKGV